MNVLSIFEQQTKAFNRTSYLPINKRRENLLAIKRLLQAHAAELADAVSMDFSHRSRDETCLLELFPAIKAIDFCIKRLHKWTRKRKRHVPW